MSHAATLDVPPLTDLAADDDRRWQEFFVAGRGLLRGGWWVTHCSPCMRRISKAPWLAIEMLQFARVPF